MIINVILWFVFGITIGLVLAFVVHKSKNDATPLMVLGIIGALVGGSVGQIVSNAHSNFNLLTLFIAAVGALLLINLYKNISPQS